MREKHYRIVLQTLLEKAEERTLERFSHELRRFRLEEERADEICDVLKRSLQYSPEGRIWEWAAELDHDIAREDTYYSRLKAQQTRIEHSLASLGIALDERLGRLESSIDNVGGTCKFSRADAEALHDELNISRLITIEPAMSGVKAQAAPAKFTSKLQKVTESASIIILVDPYGLSEVSETGEKGDCVAKIVDLCALNSILELHIYCRTDAVSVSVWKKLEDALVAKKKKLTVHLGDLHDRYLLCDGEARQKGELLTSQWHGCVYWRGVVFGASLNGTSKRPTYVLPFEPNDLKEIRRYLNDRSEETDRINFETNQKERQRLRTIATLEREAAMAASHVNIEGTELKTISRRSKKTKPKS